MNTVDLNKKLSTLKARSAIINKIRNFFVDRNFLEVETPLLCSTTATDPHISSFKVSDRYLQTSPEFAMKRILANGSGPIFQICKAFRNEQLGRFHNPEFTMLEWYHPGFDHHDLMDEMDEFLQWILQTTTAKRMSYAKLFTTYLQLDPFNTDVSLLKECALKHGLKISLEDQDRDTWLNLLLIHLIEPHLGHEQPLFIYDFPPSQAALSKIRADTPAVAERFEVYVKGIELANGYHEVIDAKEQRRRFLVDQQRRKELNYPVIPIDENLLAVLEDISSCAGVALGIDRLIMLALQTELISDVISFSWNEV